MDEVTLPVPKSRAAPAAGLLLDVNNVFVSATHQGTDDRAYVEAFPLEAVGEIHLGGHDAEADEHGPPPPDRQPWPPPVVDPVWTTFTPTPSPAQARAPR